MSLFDSENYLYFYAPILTPERLASELDFLRKYTYLDEPKKILDLACGHGRHANALALEGHTVTGIDLSDEFLAIARSEAKNEVEYKQQDMRTIDYVEEFDRVYSLFTAIGYFSDQENEQLFQAIYKALKPGGIFCFDSHNREAFSGYCLPRIETVRNGDIMVDYNTFDEKTGRCTTRRVITRDQQEREFIFEVRFYSPGELETLFNKIGFSACHFYGNWEGGPLVKDSKRMIVVVEK